MKLTLSFQSSYFLHDEKVKIKNWITSEKKELLRWSKKHFSSFLRRYQLQKSCLRHESAPFKVGYFLVGKDGKGLGTWNVWTKDRDAVALYLNKMHVLQSLLFTS